MTRSSHTPAKQIPALAESADILGGQMRKHLSRLGSLLGSRSDVLDRKFIRNLTASKHDQRQRVALSALTLGSAVRFWLKDGNLDGYFEQVSYSGRRLAKLNLSPSAIVTALSEYDKLLDTEFAKLASDEAANFRWVREQLQFCAMLSLNNAYYEIREAEAAAFYELFRDEVESRSLVELFDKFLETLTKYCRADGARYLGFDAANNCWRGSGQVFPNTSAISQRLLKPQCGAAKQLLTGVAWQGNYATVWSMPLIHGDRLTGVFQFAFKKPYQWLPREQELLSAAADRCVEAAEKARLIEDLKASDEQIRRLAEHMLQVEEMERRRISGELHDEAGQSMLFVRLQMEMVEHALPAELHPIKLQVKGAREATERTIVEIRRLIAALSPAALEQLGLGAALKQLVMRFKQWYPVKVKLQLGHLRGLPKKTEVVVYRLVQECFNNISKHSFATTVNISVETSDGSLRLIVEDNGIGFDVEHAATKLESFGLQGMRERVVLLGGTCEVVSNPVKSGRPKNKTPQRAREIRGDRPKFIKATGQGTKIWIQLPIPREAVAA